MHSYLGICLFIITSVSSTPTYSPLRPPSLPLAVRTPYFSAWTSTSGNDTLNNGGAILGTSPKKSLEWEGVVTVDGVSYEWLGNMAGSLPKSTELKKAEPLAVTYDSQYSNFTFAAGPVRLVASFFSPVEPTDLCQTSVPLSYLTVSVESNSSKHSVSLYGHVGRDWLSDRGNIKWDFFKNKQNITQARASCKADQDDVLIWKYGLEDPIEMGEDEHGLPTWGDFSYSSSLGDAYGMTYGSGSAGDLLHKYIDQGEITFTIKNNTRKAPKAFAFAHQFGVIPRKGKVQITYTLGLIQDTVINYSSPSGCVALKAWWKHCDEYEDALDMIIHHYQDLSQAQDKAFKWDHQLNKDVDRFFHTKSHDKKHSRPKSHSIADVGLSERDAYYAIVALSARQIMGSYVLAKPAFGSLFGSPYIFQKEISSNGNMNTVDVIYAAMPFFLYANPEFLYFLLKPLYEFQEKNNYPQGYAMHDIGAHFPNATGYPLGDDEPMPVESSANMIIMSLAYAKFSGANEFLKTHYEQLKLWAQYLVNNCLFPTNQLSTDDFSGTLTNQTNLAIKGIIAIKAMSEVAKRVGDLKEANKMDEIAKDYISQWENLAIDGNHALLSYKWRGSYSMLYNTYPDKLLRLGLIPQSIHDMQSHWYPKISHTYGIPLDSRHLWSKSDWSLWTAATSSKGTRSLIIKSIARWLNETPTNLPFTDLYDTGSGDFPVKSFGPNFKSDSITFSARPVAGGHFSLLALNSWISKD